MNTYQEQLKEILRKVDAKPASLAFLRTCAIWYKESQSIPIGGPQVMSTIEKQLLETIAYLVK